MANTEKKFKSGVLISGTAQVDGDTITTNTAAQTLQNKTIDGSNSIDTAALPSNIDASKIADGSVSNTEFQYINTLTSNAQDQIDSKISSTEKGAANGVATLGADSKIPSAQIPAIALTEVFVVADITARDALTVQEGDVAKVTDASDDPAVTSGSAAYIYDGSAWVRLNVADQVLSVNGQTGAVVLTADDVSAANTALSNLAATDLQGVTLNGAGHFYPDASNTYDIGTAAFLWRTARARTYAAYNNTGVSKGQVEGNARTMSDGNTADGLLMVNSIVSNVSSDVAMLTFDDAGANANATGDIFLETGNKTAGTGNSGNIKLHTGTSSGGTRGTIELSAGADDARLANQPTGANALAIATTQYVDDAVAAVDTGASAGDIPETSFAAANNQASAVNVTGLAFANATVRSFEALVSVAIDADSDLFEVFTLKGIQKGADWDMAVDSVGDTSNISFTITSAGQVQYTSGNEAGFVSNTMKFRAITTSL